jgi:hypothetical protein
MITWIETINLTLQDLKNPEYQVERSLEKTKYEGLNDRIISVKLSVFSLQSLEYTEKRLRLLIESKEIDYKRAIDVLAPCFGIFIGALIVWQYNTVNNTPNAINAILANLIVISGIITILLKAYITYLDKPTLYKRGLHIVEYAKIIKDNNEQSPINNSNKIKNYQNVMDVLIHGPKIDVDPDFDHNS